MPKIRGANLAEHRRETRDRLFDALKELMGSEGFHSVTMSQIAERAGVGRSSVYNHFPDKESLLIEMIRHETDRYLRALTAELDSLANPLAQLTVYIQFQALLDRSFHVMPGPAIRTMLSPQALTRIREHATAIENLLRRILSDCTGSGLIRDADPEQSIPLINAAIFGPRLPKDPGPARDTALTAMKEFILRGLGASESDIATVFAGRPAYR